MKFYGGGPGSYNEELNEEQLTRYFSGAHNHTKCCL